MFDGIGSVVVGIGIIGMSVIANWLQGDIDDVLRGHRCSAYCSPGMHVRHREERTGK